MAAALYAVDLIASVALGGFIFAGCLWLLTLVAFFAGDGDLEGER